MLVTDSKVATTPRINIEVAIKVKIGHVTTIVLVVPVVPTVIVIGGSRFEASFWAREKFFGLIISAKILPLLECV